MNISLETVKTLEDLGYSVMGRKGHKVTDVGLPYSEATDLDLSLVEGDYISMWSFKTPKVKEVTTEWVLSKINMESSYRNLSQYLQRVFKHSISVYPASYGIGVDTLGGYKKSADEVAAKLEELGLKYRNEFSDAAWVYRFVISKDRENMAIMEGLK